MYDLIIIGAGPAGISAALYACRAKLSVLILGKEDGALLHAHRIENYYGLATPISGAELAAIGRQQAETLGAVILPEQVLGLGYGDGLEVQTDHATYHGRAVLLATGASRNRAKIEGLTPLEGRGVSYCAICDAFFFRGKSVAVLGSGEYALHELQDLMPHAKQLSLLTNGAPLTVNPPDSVTVDTRPIQAIVGAERVEAVQFADGDTMPLDGLFVALGTAGATDLARKVGAVVDGNRIVVDDKMQTNIPGLYAAGDCTGGVLQISTAVAEGTKAALAIIAHLR